MIPTAAPFKLPSRSVLSLTETVLHMALSAAIPISAVVFAVLSF
jgi:hypothetical protein